MPASTGNPPPTFLDAIRPDKKINLSVVITREEVATVTSPMDGTTHLVAKPLYGRGVRIMEAVRGSGPRTSMCDEATGRPCGQRLHRPVQHRSRYPDPRCTSRSWLRGVARCTFLMRWLGNTPMPPRNGAGRTAFPARNFSVDVGSGVSGRHHVALSGINNTIKVAVHRADLTKPVSAYTFRHPLASHLLQDGTAIRAIQPPFG